jgi:hypothetical protein
VVGGGKKGRKGGRKSFTHEARATRDSYLLLR